jgi:hypothetical protein
MTPPAFTPEQRAAIAARAGSSLLAANAGSGKTAVMVERIAAAVREDGVPVGAILALTFTEKAAGELAERLRRRLLELGEAEHARAVDAAWIGTIHGFCARLLRSQPLAAGLDPRFTVLDEAAAGRLATAAYESALDAWAREAGLEGTIRPVLLGEPSIRILALHGGDGMVAGAIANRTGSVVGVSNVFAAATPGAEPWNTIAAALGHHFPGLPLVGYERGVALPAALASGFRDIGPLRVWLRPALGDGTG